MKKHMMVKLLGSPTYSWISQSSCLYKLAIGVKTCLMSLTTCTACHCRLLFGRTRICFRRPEENMKEIQDFRFYAGTISLHQTLGNYAASPTQLMTLLQDSIRRICI
ncbi:hypothetical protein Ancab_000514 [Ancistrocladus abbreviatus]